MLQHTQKLCIHFVYKNCTRCIRLMYTKCIQNVYHIKINSKSKELCQLNFVYKMYTQVCRSMRYIVYKVYTKLCRNMGYILYTNILYRFCIHQFWSTKSVHHKHYLYNLYTKFIQNVYTDNCMQNGSLISTYFWPVCCALPS